MMDYSEGLKHGYEDMANLVGKELAADIPDAEKLERIGWLVAPHTVSVTYHTPSLPRGNPS